MSRPTTLWLAAAALLAAACGDIYVPDDRLAAPPSQQAQPASQPQLEASCGAIPTAGCCAPDGNLVYCSDAGKVEVEECGRSGQLCGWSYESVYYACGDTTDRDPTGQHPYACPKGK